MRTECVRDDVTYLRRWSSAREVSGGGETLASAMEVSGEMDETLGWVGLDVHVRSKYFSYRSTSIMLSRKMCPST